MREVKKKLKEMYVITMQNKYIDLGHMNLTVKSSILIFVKLKQ